MATLASTVIDRVIRGFRRHDNPDVLNGDIDDSATTLTYTGVLSGWGPGVIIEIGSELMLVTAHEPSSNSVTITRGWLGTTAVAHSNGDAIYIGARADRGPILDLFNDCIEDMVGRDLYAVDATEITYNPSFIGYNLPSTVLDVLRVDALKDDAAKYWEPVFDWLYVDNASTSDFANGKALMLRAALPPGSFRVVYAKAFTRLTSESDDLETTVGMRPYMTDLPFYFAMNRIMVDLERRRSQIESAESHQRAQDAPPFLALRTGEWYQARYEDRVKNSRARLLKETKKLRVSGYGS